MYKLIRCLPARKLLSEQLPAFILSASITELFYKFHNFTLETGAFQTIWFALDGPMQLFRRRRAQLRLRLLICISPHPGLERA